MHRLSLCPGEKGGKLALTATDEQRDDFTYCRPEDSLPMPERLAWHSSLFGASICEPGQVSS